MKTQIISLATFAILSIAGMAHADASGPNAKNFEKEIDAYQKACKTVCTSPFNEVDVYDIRQPKNTPLDDGTQAKLKQIALEQAQIWGDTILEGDYYSEGNTQVDHVSAIYDKGQFAGYKIIYSERAWYTGECNFSPDKLDTLKACSEGRIHEASFVSPDFQTYFRDDSDLANFVN